ncbi:RNA-binding protein Nova-1-like isoform X2 [Hylaeus volcanicus]|uniref:RNA-binding protein Nova-1-like isoform X2 n=1 Tax=Hylaeus volcanicus TaxID=313075 RepID=UPI0023B83F31|nr:RNA-binding protein Nova-1-like isoform X2 [Hylaeus volcanicus]
MSNGSTLDDVLPYLTSTSVNDKHEMGRSSVNVNQEFDPNRFKNNQVLDSSIFPDDHSRNNNETTDTNAVASTSHDNKTLLNSNVNRIIFPGATCYLKLLVSNLVAGSVIGSKGSTVTHISNATNCSIKLSNANSYYPGTNERVIVITGRLQELQKAFAMILERIQESNTTSNLSFPLMKSSFSQDASTANSQDSRLLVKIVVPNSAVSQIIGRQGTAVKELQEKTNTKIQISNRDDRQLKERVVKITGLLENVTEASTHIIESIQTDPHIKDHTKVDYSTIPHHPSPQFDSLDFCLPGMITRGAYITPQSGFNISGSVGNRAMMGNSAGSMDTTSHLPPHLNQQKSLTPLCHPNSSLDINDPLLWNSPLSGPLLDYNIEIPDSCIGLLIGKNGVTLQNIQEQAGVKIQISGKGELVPGTENRRLTISGNPVRIQCAAVLLQHKLQAIKNAPRPHVSSSTQSNRYSIEQQTSNNSSVQEAAHSTKYKAS